MWVKLSSFSNLGARKGYRQLIPHPNHFTPQERNPVLIVQEAG
jgi:hypothetical protein